MRDYCFFFVNKYFKKSKSYAPLKILCFILGFKHSEFYHDVKTKTKILVIFF